MGIPETIVAAGIGGAATVTAAVFQLYTALRVKSGQSPKKTTSFLRSWFTTTALMIASAAGGYVCAEYRQQQALDDSLAVHAELRAMRDEINAQLLVLAQSTGRLVQDHRTDSDPHGAADLPSHAPRTAENGCEATSDAPTPCAGAELPETSAVAPPADGVAL